MPLCTSAGLPYEVLAVGHFVPGTERWEIGKYRGKELWRTILEVTNTAAVMYCKRVIAIFDSRAGKDSSSKAKA